MKFSCSKSPVYSSQNLQYKFLDWKWPPPLWHRNFITFVCRTLPLALKCDCTSVEMFVKPLVVGAPGHISNKAWLVISSSCFVLFFHRRLNLWLKEKSRQICFQFFTSLFLWLRFFTIWAFSLILSARNFFYSDDHKYVRRLCSTYWFKGRSLRSGSWWI